MVKKQSYIVINYMIKLNPSKIENIHLSLCSNKTKGFPVYQHMSSAHSSVAVVGGGTLIPVALVLLETLQQKISS